MFGQGAVEYDPLIYKHEKQHPKEKKVEYGKYLQNSSQKTCWRRTQREWRRGVKEEMVQKIIGR
jgi:hypothetical protein